MAMSFSAKKAYVKAVRSGKTWVDFIDRPKPVLRKTPVAITVAMALFPNAVQLPDIYTRRPNGI